MTMQKQTYSEREQRTLRYAESPRERPQAISLSTQEKQNQREETQEQLIALKEEIEKPNLREILKEIDSEKIQKRNRACIKLRDWILQSIEADGTFETVKTLLKEREKSQGEVLLQIDRAIKKIDDITWSREIVDNNDMGTADAVLRLVIDSNNSDLLFAIATGFSQSSTISEKVLTPLILSERKKRTILRADIIIATAMAKGNANAFVEFFRKNINDVEAILGEMGNTGLPYICRAIQDPIIRMYVEELKDASVDEHIANILMNENEDIYVRIQAALHFARFDRRPARIDNNDERKAWEAIEETAGKILNSVLLNVHSLRLTQEVVLTVRFNERIARHVRKGLLSREKQYPWVNATENELGSLQQALATIGEVDTTLKNLKKYTLDEEGTLRVLESISEYIYRSEGAGKEVSDQAQLPPLSDDTMQNLRKFLQDYIQENPEVIFAHRVLCTTARDEKSAEEVSDTLIPLVDGSEESLKTFTELCEMQLRLHRCPADVYKAKIEKMLSMKGDEFIPYLILTCSFETSVDTSWQKTLQDFAFKKKFDKETREKALARVPADLVAVRAELMETMKNPEEEIELRVSAMLHLLEWTVENKGLGSKELETFSDDVWNQNQDNMNLRFIHFFEQGDEIVMDPGRRNIERGITQKDIGVRLGTLEICRRFPEYRTFVARALRDNERDVRKRALELLQANMFFDANDMKELREIVKDPKQRTIEVIDALIISVLDKKFEDIIPELVDLRSKNENSAEENEHLDAGLEEIRKLFPANEAVKKWQRSKEAQ